MIFKERFDDWKAKSTYISSENFSVFYGNCHCTTFGSWFYSYHSAVSAVRDSIRQSNETALLQVENRTENVLDAVRQDFLMIAGRSSTKEIIDQEYDDIPYPSDSKFY